jgi:ribokinase
VTVGGPAPRSEATRLRAIGPRSRVLVVGSVNVDLVVTTERLPGVGETVTGGTLVEHDGGKGGNQAVAAARLGAPTAFVGAVGNDAFGDRARRVLAGEGVDIEGVTVLDGRPTGVAFILVDARGENLIAVASGTNMLLTPDLATTALDRLAPGPGDVVLVSHEIPTATSRAALELGRARGATTILNPAPADGLDAEALTAADILTPNEGELEVLRSVGLPDTAALLVSLGADGARLDERGASQTLGALRVDALDTVGAGDTLNGALAAGLAAGLDLPTAAARAVAAASLSVTRPGARGGMPTLAELEAALEA